MRTRYRVIRYMGLIAIYLILCIYSASGFDFPGDWSSNPQSDYDKDTSYVKTTQLSEILWLVEMTGSKPCCFGASDVMEVNQHAVALSKSHNIVNIVPIAYPGGDSSKAGITLGYWIFVDDNL